MSNETVKIDFEKMDGLVPGIESTAYFDPTHSAYGSGAAACLVAVEPRTGEFEIERFVLVHDCGTQINPTLVEGQVQGGLSQALGAALMEELLYDPDTGQLRNGTMMDYFAPTAAARENLLREGVADSRIWVTGNTAVDAVLDVAARRAATQMPARGRRIAVEVHRRESFGAPLRDVVLALRDIARAFPDVELLWSVHPNPNVGPVVRELMAEEPRVRLIPPSEYPDWVGVLAGSHLLVTDSGGLQEEAPALHLPVVCTRNKTERPEAVAAGTVVLAGTERQSVFDSVARLLRDPEAYRRCAEAPNPFGDGHASERIVAAIRGYLEPVSRPRQ